MAAIFEDLPLVESLEAAGKTCEKLVLVKWSVSVKVGNGLQIFEREVLIKENYCQVNRLQLIDYP